ncbi:MAG: ABC transporter ATP-binding protein, partial [Acutalibacteraceae bacterium]
MIKVSNVTKTFGDFTALKDMSCEIPEGCIYGLVGSNGAGKSTFLRLITGIYKADSGEIEIDGKPVWENEAAKRDFVLVPDELYFIQLATMEKMSRFYSAFYPNFNFERFNTLTQKFGLDPKKRISGFSKGMKRQAAIICALSCQTKYLFFDETFDGLDPVMRNLVKNIIFDDICERKATAVITSHSLRELEDTCDQLTLLHKGGIIFESDVQNLKTSLFKVQVAFKGDYDKKLFTDSGIEVLDFKKTGMVSNVIVRGDREEVRNKLTEKKPVLFDILPLSLEEVFIFETGALGYQFSDVLDS